MGGLVDFHEGIQEHENCGIAKVRLLQFGKSTGALNSNYFAPMISLPE